MSKALHYDLGIEVHNYKKVPVSGIPPYIINYKNHDRCKNTYTYDISLNIPKFEDFNLKYV